MSIKMFKDKFIQRFLFLIALALAIWFLWAIRSIFLYLAIATIFALIASPAVDWLEGRRIGPLRIPNVASVILVMVAIFLLFAGTLSLLIPLVASQAENLSLLDAAKAKENVIHMYHNVVDVLVQYGIIDSPPQVTADYLGTLDFSFLTNFFNSVVSSIGSLLTLIFSVLFFAFFFLKERHRATSFILSVVPDEMERGVSGTLQKTRNLLSRYLIGLFLQQGVIFCLTLILLLSFGIQNPFIISFLVALVNIIPYLGPVIGGTLVVTLSLLGDLPMSAAEMIPRALYVLAGFIGIQMIDNFVSQPLIFSTSVKAHPLEIFIVILVGGTLFGILGMIVAVPSYTILRIVAKEFFSNSKLVKVFTKDI